MSKPGLLLTILISTWSLLHFPGCSLIGLGIGALSDANSPDEYIFTPAGLDSIKQGSTVEVKTTHGGITSGEYERIDAVPSEEYSAWYKSALDLLPMGNQMPGLGDSILIVTHGALGRKTYSGTLLGFDGGIIRAHLTDRKAPVGMRVEAVDTLCHDETTVVPGDVLRHHLNNGNIPYMSTLVIRNEQGIQRIFASEILNVREPVSNYGKLTGFLVGLAVDAAFGIAISNKHFGP